MAFRYTDDQVRDANQYDADLCNEELYCYFCERKLAHERALRINGDLICLECADDHYGEEV